MSTAISFHLTTTPVFHLADPDMSFLQDVHPEVTDALLGFLFNPLDPPDNVRLDDFLGPLPDQDDTTAQHRGKWPHSCVVDDDGGASLDFAADACGLVQQWGGCAAQTQVPALPELLTEFVLPPPPPPMQHKYQQLPQAFEAARHVKLLQAQLGMLALMHTVEVITNPIDIALTSDQTLNSSPYSQAKVLSVTQEQMHALLVCGGVQEQLAGEDKCLVPRKLVHTIANDKTIKSNQLVNRDLNRFMESLGK
ncbi:hypothetical protein ABZP36_006398 [Zizania latifolia]